MRFSLISLTRNPLRTYISKSFPNTITFHIKKALHIVCLHLLLASIYFIEANKNGKQIERGEMYKVVYSHRDGTALNEIAEANIDGTSKDEEDNSNNNKAVENSLEGDSKED
ncbi:uncharacterized protein LOC112012069 isoform X1 [Quercus suber]|uniref:uncharacterized protein LOC112012069 isoform X1 n=1 Tax=Quercus suber TaxID=58331 RepID=UPI000CE264AB|nr:uncharacterized protein LOC112012069 isoform X1 [Quercus suber]XP_023900193.1 uncharacterized protein LOC112012069 isoform X1 [Quercus suber]XP_023900194.1 uncharacterized protein LOC112012069 isoform X1 [Quercus suber]XP_023900195.1 uncharacterized protein LOC112012069 isoform X1 [Quercus suber]XP_023900197.1 uncharacterized protein LOC112012069 isoform X2 [Quercus suber]POE50981.1 hypothetical protein CFP56_64798 [Quercus suber]